MAFASSTQLFPWKTTANVRKRQRDATSIERGRLSRCQAELLGALVMAETYEDVTFRNR